MSDYKLYGECLIENDSTLESFARCVMELVPTDDLAKREKEYEEELNETEYEDEFMNRVEEILEHDIVRTDIKYDELMNKYSAEIGPLLREFENHGGNIESIGLSFFGESAKRAFNRRVTEKVWFLKFYRGDV